MHFGAQLEAAALGHVDAVRDHPEPLVGLGSECAEQTAELKRYLYDHLYCHPRVVQSSERAVYVIGELFEHYRADPSSLPDHVRGNFGTDGEVRAIADYIAGMTDRFALEEHRGLGVGP